MSWNIIEHATLPTTMDEARTQARAGCADRTVIVARMMTGGKGQHGRSWVAPEGGIYITLVLREVAKPALLTLAIGQAVADLLEMTGIDAQTKWPNDVMVNGKKIAGILTEAETTSKLEFALVGIGLNMSQKLPADLRATTIDLELGVESCFEDTLAALLDAIDARLDELVHQPNNCLDSARSRDFLLGKRIKIEGFEGVGEGLGEGGELVVSGKQFVSGSASLL